MLMSVFPGELKEWRQSLLECTLENCKVNSCVTDDGWGAEMIDKVPSDKDRVKYGSTSSRIQASDIQPHT